MNTKTIQHTPGPWEIDGEDIIHVEDENHCAPICTVNGLVEAENDFNASLIASAPELLAALKGIIVYAENEATALHEMVESEETQREADAATQFCEAALAAIAKAEGVVS